MTGSSGTSSFCTMGGMHTMHQHQRMLQQSDDWPVILPNNTEHEDKMDNGDGQDHSGHDMNGHNNSNSHSHGMSMGGSTMYMDGFHWALFPSSQEIPPPCLNLFHPSWTLHTQSKFLFAMAFVTMLGIFVEACGVWRVKCLRKGRGHRRELKLKQWRRWEEQHRQDTEGQRVGESLRIPRGMRSAMSDISDVSSNEEAPAAAANAAPSNRICPAIVRRVWVIVPRCIRTPCAKICCCFLPHTKNDATLARRYDAAAAGLHATRAALGYLLMLSVMTYAVEFLLSAVAGMVLGRYWFVDRDGGDNSGGGVMNGAVGVGGGVGGMGLGEGGRQNSGPGVGMTDMQGGNDGTWGGADPCCGIDDDDEDEDGNDRVEDSYRSGGSLHEPLLSPLTSNVGVTRRSGVLPPEENPL